MTDIRKNLIIIIFFLSGIFLVLLFLNFSASSKKQGAAVFEPQSAIPTDLPKKVSRGPVVFFDFKNGSGKAIFYEEFDSTVYEADLDGKNKKELARIPNASGILFNPNGKGLIAEVPGKGSPTTAYFDLENNRKTELPKNIRSAAFSPDGEKLAYYFYDDKTGRGNISTAEPDGLNSGSIFLTRIKDLNLAWPENELLVFYPKSGGGQAFSVMPDGNNFRRLDDEESLRYFNHEKEEAAILQEMGIKAAGIKLSPLGDYLIFLNAGDGKLYSLRL